VPDPAVDEPAVDEPAVDEPAVPAPAAPEPPEPAALSSSVLVVTTHAEAMNALTTPATATNRQ
jgi:hypothetical protein